MSKTKSYAEHELDILEKTVTDAIITPFREELLALVDKFGKSGQSGGSAPYTASALSQAVKKLCLQEPICSITGIDEEWVDVAEYNNGDSLYQNNRCHALFKEGRDERPYYLDAIVWKTPKGVTYTGSAYLPNGEIVLSRQHIKGFPFEPKTFYVDVTEEEVAPDDWVFHVRNRDLNEVYSYYYHISRSKKLKRILE
jgi:hypothetical protein